MWGGSVKLLPSHVNAFLLRKKGTKYRSLRSLDLRGKCVRSDISIEDGYERACNLKKGIFHFWTGQLLAYPESFFLHFLHRSGTNIRALPIPELLSSDGLTRTYRLGLREIDSALWSYRPLDPQGKFINACVPSLRTYYEVASKIAPGVVDEIPAEVAGALNQIELEPVIANLGVEVSDLKDGTFYLHLATGTGRQVALNTDKAPSKLWTPTSFVVHSTEIISTAKWQSETLKKLEGVLP